MIDSLAAAKAYVLSQITTGGVPTEITQVYDHEERPGNVLRPISLTVSTGGMDSEYFHVAVRLYVDITTDAKTAQDSMDSIMTAIDAKVNETSAWVVGLHPEIDGMLVAEWVAEVGREDF